jgi:hypothetical protein
MFCTRCKIPREDLGTEKAFTTGRILPYLHTHLILSRVDYEPRTSEEHRRLAKEYRRLPDNEKNDFFNEHAMRYFELSRLPYFDPVRMSIIDPMHNILLGESLFLSIVF